jgi:hypothetical protein
MKIAISVAVGPLHKWGYQHVCRECLASQAEFADHVYMIQSTEDATGVQELLDEFPNITLISNPATWHHLPGQTDEALPSPHHYMGLFTTFHMRNLSIGRGAAFDDGISIVLSTHNNWYIPRRNVSALREYCEEFAAGGTLTGHTWMWSQLHNKLFGPGMRNCGLCNTTGMLDRAAVEEYYPDMKFRYQVRSTIPEQVKNICMVDCSYNLLPSEFEGMHRRFFYPGYRTFDWNSKRAIIASRLMRKCFVQDVPLDYWGEKIAAKSRPDWMGYQLLQEAGLL